jgi:hypothetical protein
LAARHVGASWVLNAAPSARMYRGSSPQTAPIDAAMKVRPPQAGGRLRAGDHTSMDDVGLLRRMPAAEIAMCRAAGMRLHSEARCRRFSRGPLLAGRLEQYPNNANFGTATGWRGNGRASPERTPRRTSPWRAKDLSTTVPQPPLERNVCKRTRGFAWLCYQQVVPICVRSESTSARNHERTTQQYRPGQHGS